MSFLRRVDDKTEDILIPLLIGDALTSDRAEVIPWFDGIVEDSPEKSSPPSPPPLPPRLGSAAAQKKVRVDSVLVDEGEIARGGFGSIRQIYDPELRRRVAMKVLSPDIACDKTSSKRFVDEARITGYLDHPNIVPVHDIVVNEAGIASYTMKLVRGETLSELIAAQRTNRDLQHILEVLIKVCEALAFAHGHGVIHRDLKPDNIMVGSHGQVYVMDWGCAQVFGAARAIVDMPPEDDGIVAGTVAYMAPEQARGLVSKIDGRTDVFGVGAMLYKVLTGSAPYPGPGLEVLARAQQGKIVPPDERVSGSMTPPPHLSQLAMKAMAVEPSARFQSTEELGDALREFLRGGNWFPMQIFAKGSVIVKEGDPANAAYIITAGLCEAVKRDPKNPELTISLRALGPGDVFGETAIFANAPRSASVIALENVKVVVVDRSAIENLTQSSWLGLFVKALANRFLEVDDKLAALRK